MGWDTKVKTSYEGVTLVKLGGDGVQMKMALVYLEQSGQIGNMLSR